MIRLIVGAIMLLAGLLTSIFVAQEALKFQVIQMIVAVILFTLIMLGIVFWPRLKEIFKNIVKK